MENKYLKQIFETGLKSVFPNIFETEISFDIPKNTDYGDLATNVCMRLAKPLHSNPREIAEKLIKAIKYDAKYIEKIELAGTGFINIRFTPFYYQEQLNGMNKQGDEYGKTYVNKGKSVNVEYVSANPTGMLHLGHGRNAAIGDTLANLYQWTGWNVTREYYFNNAGNQMNNLAKSIYARMMQIQQNVNFQFPEDGYHGEYVKIIAQELVNKYNGKLIEGTEDNYEIIRKYGEKWCFAKIKRTLERMNIQQDIFYNEDSLYKEDKIKEVLEELKTKGLIYEKDGAVWLALTKMGLQDDRVIVKSTGEPTYRLPDIAYHREKLLRNYDLVVDLFGADHIATVPDVLAGVRALGFDAGKVKVVIHQFVTLTENGEQVKMSKRTGKSYTLDDLLDDVGEDIVRFFLIMRGVNTHLEFDLSLAKEQSDKNPLFYLQYAYARICSVFEKIASNNINFENANLQLLNDISEISLIKQLMRFPEMLTLASNKSEPQIVCEYLREVATAFHLFYHNCRIIIEDIELMKARLLLANVTKLVLRNGLTILGVSSPEQM